MLTRAARLFHSELVFSPGMLVQLAVVMGIAYEIGRHGLWWFMATGFFLFDSSGHALRTHHESELMPGLIWFGVGLAWIAGAWLAQGRVTLALGGMLGLFGENTQTTLLSIIAFPGLNIIFALFFFATYPVIWVLFPVYLVYVIVMTALSLFGVRLAVERWLQSRGGSVIDFATRLPLPS